MLCLQPPHVSGQLPGYSHCSAAVHLVLCTPAKPCDCRGLSLLSWRGAACSTFEVPAQRDDSSCVGLHRFFDAPCPADDLEGACSERWLSRLCCTLPSCCTCDRLVLNGLSAKAGSAEGSPSVQETANMSAPDPGWLREVAGSQCRSVQKVGRVHTCRSRAHRDVRPAQKQNCIIPRTCISQGLHTCPMCSPMVFHFCMV